jgi:hypothetical protein
MLDDVVNPPSKNFRPHGPPKSRACTPQAEERRGQVGLRNIGGGPYGAAATDGK